LVITCPPLDYAFQNTNYGVIIFHHNDSMKNPGKQPRQAFESAKVSLAFPVPIRYNHSRKKPN